MIALENQVQRLRCSEAGSTTRLPTMRTAPAWSIREALLSLLAYPMLPVPAAWAAWMSVPESPMRVDASAGTSRAVMAWVSRWGLGLSSAGSGLVRAETQSS